MLDWLKTLFKRAEKPESQPDPVVTYTPHDYEQELRDKFDKASQYEPLATHEKKLMVVDYYWKLKRVNKIISPPETAFYMYELDQYIIQKTQEYADMLPEK